MCTIDSDVLHVMGFSAWSPESEEDDTIVRQDFADSDCKWCLWKNCKYKSIKKELDSSIIWLKLLRQCYRCEDSKRAR